MRWVKLAVFAVLAGALAAANLLFKDRLAERGLEAALQGVFRAQAEVEGLSLKLLGGRVSFRSLRVADEKEPMTNLFELGPTEAELNLAQLLRRKVVIESVACTDIRWATPRAASGALPAAAPAAASPTSAQAAPGLTLPGLDALGLDPAALLAREKANLKSPAAYEQADAQLKAASQRWQARSASLMQKTDKVGEAAAALQKIDFRSVNSLEEARKGYDAVEQLSPAVVDLQKDLKTAGGDFRADSAALREAASSAQRLLDEDVAALRSRVTVPEGGLKGVISGLARRVVEQKLGNLSAVAFKAADAAGRLRESRTDVKKTRATRRGGRDVPFPTTTAPAFLLKHFAFSVRPEGASLAGELKDVSSNPELWGRPATFDAEYRSGGRSVRARCEIDSRDGSSRTRVEARGSGLDFALSGLPLIATASGTYGFATAADVEKGGVAGTARVTTGRVSAGEANDLAGRVVKASLEGAAEVVLDVQFRNGSFAVASNLDDEITRQLGARLADLAADYRKQAEAELRKSMAPQVAQVQQGLGALDGTGGQLGALDGRAEGYRRQIDAKKAEYAAAITRLGGGRIRIPGF